MKLLCTDMQNIKCCIRAQSCFSPCQSQIIHRVIGPRVTECQKCILYLFIIYYLAVAGNIYGVKGFMISFVDELTKLLNL